MVHPNSDESKHRFILNMTDHKLDRKVGCKIYNQTEALTIYPISTDYDLAKSVTEL